MYTSINTYMCVYVYMIGSKRCGSFMIQLRYTAH